VAERIGILVDGVLRVDCPTDHFKESIRKVLLELKSEADGESAKLADCPGLVSRRQVGRKLELVVAGFGDRHRALFDSLGVREIDVIDFNLEDAFIESTRGPRRSLPIFATEEAEKEVAHA
jgi:ABC-2 type transport system ATP-binding protein